MTSYDPKLREAMSKIQAILKNYDIGGYVSLSSETHGEFFLELEPSWSMIRWVKDGERAYIKLHMKSNPEKTESTVGMIGRQQELLGRTYLLLDDVMKQIKNHCEVIQPPVQVTNEDR